jgi:acetyl esterase/lipase
MIRLLSAFFLLTLGLRAAAPAKPAPTVADVAYGTHPHEILDVYVPTKGAAPFPVLIWYGGLWQPSKGVPDPNRFLSQGIALVAVEVRTMTDAVADKEKSPVSYVMNDAVRAVQFVRLNAARWNLDPARIVVGGGSQGAQPALYVGAGPDHADAQSADPVARTSSRVSGVAAYRSQPTFDPKLMQEWVPGVKWGAPAFGCSFEESLKRRDELMPEIRRWSSEHLLHTGSAPIYFENNWGLTQPEKVTEMDYKVHSPAWGVGYQQLARKAGVTCHLKYPDHPTEGFADIWDFIVKTLKAK